MYFGGLDVVRSLSAAVSCQMLRRKCNIVAQQGGGWALKSDTEGLSAVTSSGLRLTILHTPLGHSFTPSLQQSMKRQKWITWTWKRAIPLMK
ncbi:hypothetical protein GDO78_003673 [Eleutherodactylus coqui]|uniref:Uncharacterized protein n=1 Tax=Eleutherodactylus coqui TaxID=57060 RepID=A0A8J6ET05_ELECQ|nr:hypothetical protein GDO78_003673 [Eleutherodactylus coqui]